MASLKEILKKEYNTLVKGAKAMSKEKAMSDISKQTGALKEGVAKIPMSHTGKTLADMGEQLMNIKPKKK